MSTQDPASLMKCFDLIPKREIRLQSLSKYGLTYSFAWVQVETGPANLFHPLQFEIHVVLTPTHITANILLNQLRLIGVLDLLLELKSFVVDKLPEDLTSELSIEK